MGNKTEYIMFKIETPDNLLYQIRLMELFKGRVFTLLETPTKQNCLWLKFIEDNAIWRSDSSIQNIDKIPEGLIIKTRGEVYHIHKCKLT